MMENWDMDYQTIYALALSKMFSDQTSQDEAQTILSQYGKESYHQEPDRIKVAILKLCENNPENLTSLTAQACADFRDILAWAEYPESSKRWSLKAKNPEKYHKILEKDRQQYLMWVKSLES